MNDAPQPPVAARPGDRTDGIGWAGEAPWGVPTRNAWLESAPPGVIRHVFPGLPEHVHDARTLVKDAFTGTGREDDAALIVGELAGNAIFYTRSGQPGGWFGVELAFGPRVRIAVADLGGAGWLIGQAAPLEPAPGCEARALADRHADEEELDLDDFLKDLDVPALEGIALGGRGLALIAHLAATTGAYGSPSTGHSVWAEIEVTCSADPFGQKQAALF